MENTPILHSPEIGYLEKNITFSSQDFVKLEAILSVPPQPVGIILFAFGSGSSRYSPKSMAYSRIFNSHGLATMMFALLTPQEERLDNIMGGVHNTNFLSNRIMSATKWLMDNPSLNYLPMGYFGSTTNNSCGCGAILSPATPTTTTSTSTTTHGHHQHYQHSHHQSYNVITKNGIQLIDNIGMDSRGPISLIVDSSGSSVGDNSFAGVCPSQRDRGGLTCSSAQLASDSTGSIEQVAQLCNQYFIDISAATEAAARGLDKDQPTTQPITKDLPGYASGDIKSTGVATQ
ncbi:hypothetical protein SAMD00019534_082820 [Acytostelium subglobosum LB1]|uniref:hypothetical protein n=1 Tax=Acytostelium subglobosum LB1 TaxID=1410327 RepID=UPI0006447B98|nr:hypothetical protein SAMD00019534_082820 [Acytostelium subglobosum LB1]GAM25107.1 hypothetical protein SAMD00019534_082820 [Acytostelium subglobosum LB1]|eukprot:XP_012752196.1 hypothetical protein SAMD00019534_082820 [Acytostelium subglobosum LB1]